MKKTEMNLYFVVFVVKHVEFEVILKLVEFVAVAVVVVVEHAFTPFIVKLEMLCESAWQAGSGST